MLFTLSGYLLDIFSLPENLAPSPKIDEAWPRRYN